MARSSILFTARHVAALLAEDEALIEEIAYDNPGPEEGCFSVHDSGRAEEPSVTVFNQRGIEALEELLADLRPALPNTDA